MARRTKLSELTAEVASVQRDPYHVSYGGVIRTRDTTLLSRGGGLGLDLYESVELDCFAFSQLQKRKLALIGKPWQVKSASPAPRDKRAARIVEEQLTALDFDRITLDLLDATLKGYSVAEVMWEAMDNQLVATEVRARGQRRFTFLDGSDPAADPNGARVSGFELRLLTWKDLYRGEAVPEKKFLVHSFGAKDGNPFGLGLGSRLYWPAFFKRQDIGFWLRFADRFGSPTPVGKYQNGASAEQRGKLKAALQSFTQDAAVMIPEGMSVELLQAAASGSVTAYKELAEFCNAEISAATVGETMVRATGGLGSSGAAQGDADVRLDLVKADADLLTGGPYRQLATWITEFNVPGARPPRIERIVEETTDLVQQATVDSQLAALGWERTPESILEIYGPGYVRKAPALQVASFPIPAAPVSAAA